MLNGFSLGAIWVHQRKGSNYVFLGFANEDADEAHSAEFPCLVLYRSISGGSLWALPKGVFLERFTYSGGNAGAGII